jgi:hypothetical protein
VDIAFLCFIVNANEADQALGEKLREVRLKCGPWVLKLSMPQLAAVVDQRMATNTFHHAGGSIGPAHSPEQSDRITLTLARDESSMGDAYITLATV